MLQEKMLPCHSREAVVAVRTYKNGIMNGCLRHPRLEKGEEFQSLSQMVLILDSLLDLENCPNQKMSLVEPGQDREGIALFRIQILFREHYTWQGRLIWQNENLEMVFHSAIELLALLDEILAE